MTNYLRIAGISCIAVALSTSTAYAQAEEGFYSGKTFTIAVGGTAGGGIDTGVRVLAPYLGEYLPGRPDVVVQEMGGAGGLRLLEHLYTLAPKDGTYIGAFATGPIIDPIISDRDADYVISDFTAVGSTADDVSVCVTWHDTGVTTLEDAMDQEVTVGGTGPASSTDTIPLLLNATLDTNFRVISGYVGTQETLVALEQGEVDGRCGWSYASVQSSQPDWIEEERINILVQLGGAAHPNLPDVPLLRDLISDESDLQLVNLLTAPFSINRPFLAPNDLPEERVTEIRAAFESAVNDPDYRAEFAEVFGQEPTPTNGEDMQAILEEIDATPQDVVAQLRNILSAGQQ